LVALGKAAPGAAYSAAVYVVGVVNGVWGVYRSEDAGVTWTRFNDDAHQFGGIGAMAADQNIYGRIYVSGTGRGLLYATASQVSQVSQERAAVRVQTGSSSASQRPWSRDRLYFSKREH
jgi:hypothetical protein